MSLARDPPRRSPTEAHRRRDLARMRALATGLLVLMTGVFLATRLAPPVWVWPAYVGAFAEAAMVGALADWFAVTALFRRPLGLPIPHTAIIPRNKDRIGEALGDFIAGNFLTPAVLERRLSRLEPARRLADWLAAPGRTDALARRIAEIVPQLFRPGDAFGGLVVEALRRLMRGRPLAPTAARMLDWLWRDPAVQGGFSRLVETLATYLVAQEGFIQSRVEAASWRWAPKWFDRMLAQRLTDGLLGAVDGLADPDHPWRADLNRGVEDFIRRLADDPELLERGEALKARLLTDAALPARIEALWTALAARLGPDEPGAEPSAAQEIIADLAGRGLRALGQWLFDDQTARDGLDRWIRVAARRTLSAQRQAIGGFVAQVVSGWDAAEVADRLELQVGRDLQYIRINGALVGGLAGLTIYALVRWLS